MELVQSVTAVGLFIPLESSGVLVSAQAVNGFWYPKWLWLEPIRHDQPAAGSVAPPHA